ncbi:MAG TPA: HIT family protein [Anaerolineae bacterium]|nr:HIT family protein [Anaerolineae bacterium]
MNMACLTCRSISSERRISPGPTIYEGRYWLIEHAYPTRLKGWLVIVLKRHAVALHELTREEFIELGELQALAVRLLHETLDCAKEYAVCFAEKEGFRHIHFHIVTRSHDLPDELKGTKIFAMISVTEAEALPPEEIRTLCETLKAHCSVLKIGHALE